MIGTRERILDKALELFNKNGIEYVGMRELAAELGMRIGNITYYFPTKDDLVFQLSEQYTALNSSVHAEFPGDSLYDFFKKQEQLFKNRIQYSSLMRSMVHLVDQNKMIAERYQQVQKMRKGNLKDTISLLKEKGYLKVGEDDSWFLASSCSLILRFWLSEAALTGKETAEGAYLAHYLKLVAHLFRPYTTKKGTADIQRFLAEIHESYSNI